MSGADALPASEENPIYEKVHESPSANFYMIICHEGWRDRIVCTGMYGWSADWMLEVLGRRPFANPAR